MKRKLLIAVPLLLAVILLAWHFRPKNEVLGEGYISERSVTLWSSVAQVREPLDALHYGDRVDVVMRHNESTKVRTADGRSGWVDARFLMEPALWQRSAKLIEQARALPVQARGRTKVATNLRVEPGRAQARLYQFARSVPVEIVARSVADWTATTGEKEPGGQTPEAKKEDWLLVRGLATRPPGENASRTSTDASNTTQPGDQTLPVAGWTIGRFIELDLPDTVREGTASANVRPVAWFELNRVSDPAGEKPQYLVAGTRGAEGQSCDFTNLRVYTWDQKRSRYGTAFIENNLCGAMPVRTSKTAKGEPEFRFRTKDGGGTERVYRLMQTVVRRIGESGTPVKKTRGRDSGRKKR